MFHSRMISAIIAGGMILGSTSLAFADSDHGDRDMSGRGTVITAQNTKPAPSADNPFALYRRFGQSSNAGTPVVRSHLATSKNMINQGFGHVLADQDTVR